MTRQGVEALAILGGKPAFEKVLHVGQPNIGDREKFIALITDMLDRRWLTNNGPLMQEFERRVAQFVGAKYCVAVCNATVGLEIAIRALGMTGEVIVPSFTFIATAHALQWQGIKPVFCDIDPATHCMDPAKVESLITPATTGLIGVHVWGRACQVDALGDIARRHGLRLLFDAAHAFGCSYQGRMIGGLGDAEVFSFHATKFFNTLEGGAIVTNSDSLADTARLMRNFGFAGRDRVIYLGTNGKMTEASAAMGLASFEALDLFLDTNRRNHNLYQKDLREVPGCKLISYSPTERSNYQYVVIELDEAEAGIDRDLLVDVLQAENIQARRYFYPGAHEMEPYRSLYPESGAQLPHTERLVRRVICLPTGTAVSETEVRTICEIIRFAIANHQELATMLALKQKAE